MRKLYFALCAIAVAAAIFVIEGLSLADTGGTTPADFLAFSYPAVSSYEILDDQIISRDGVMFAQTKQRRWQPPPPDLAEYPERVLAAVNVERAKVGAPPLRMEPRLAEAAKLRSREAIENLSHTRPSGQPCSSVLREFGVKSNRYFGENLARGKMTPQEAVDAWMGSPGHRENILDTDYFTTGIGVSADEYGRLFWIQIFTDLKG
jgi:uncharacterized protein YkwD